MSIPTAVFVDTSVFRGQSYNFLSTAFSTFVPACKHRELKLLLPDPTEREVKRHMVELSDEALGLIDKARRIAPFLSKVKGLPPRDISRTDVSLTAAGEWQTFLKQFDVVRLNYDGIALAKVMNWYDAGEPPFDKGKKRKEFPDAFAIAILASYAEQHGCYVAVVAHDPDLKKACDRFPSLMYFQSLPVLTELLLSAEDSRVAAFRAALDSSSSIDKIAEAAYEAAIDVTFYHGNEYSEIRDNEVRDLTLTDVRIVALGEHECTIAFDAVIRVAHKVEWFEPTGPDGEMERTGETVTRDYDVSGTAKVSMDAKTNALLDIPFMRLNEEEIKAIDIPPFWDRWR
jgi:hypothetical protein